ncbi:hypothetical protein HMPREF1556_00459, partial [Porphyromonas sp. oral taxon 278 str. W7784]
THGRSQRRPTMGRFWGLIQGFRSADPFYPCFPHQMDSLPSPALCHKKERRTKPVLSPPLVGELLELDANP